MATTISMSVATTISTSVANAMTAAFIFAMTQGTASIFILTMTVYF